MNFDTFLSKVNHIKTGKLKGLEAQFALAPKMRLRYSEADIKERKPHKASVLALFYPDKQNNTRFLLTERATYKGIHSAQISFPGGKITLSDKNLQQTALRETFEEVGIAENHVTILRKMTEVYIAPSNFLVSPFIGYIEYPPLFVKNQEVASIIEIVVEDLLDNANLTSVKKTTSYMNNIEVPCFRFSHYEVWGATAMALSEIKELLKLKQL